MSMIDDPAGIAAIPEPVQPPAELVDKLAELRAEVDKLSLRNAPSMDDVKDVEQATMRRLQQLGAQGIGLDQTQIVQARLNFFIDHVLGIGDSSVGRRQFEIDWQGFVNGQLDRLEAEVRMAKLTQGVNGATLPPRPGALG